MDTVLAIVDKNITRAIMSVNNVIQLVLLAVAVVPTNVWHANKTLIWITFYVFLIAELIIIKITVSAKIAIHHVKLVVELSLTNAYLVTKLLS